MLLGYNDYLFEEDGNGDDTEPPFLHLHVGGRNATQGNAMQLAYVAATQTPFTVDLFWYMIVIVCSPAWYW